MPKKKFGIFYNIHPGITHDEINPDNKSINGKKCQGLLWYNHFCINPKGFENIDLSKIIFDINNKEIEKKILDNINSDQEKISKENYMKNELNYQKISINRYKHTDRNMIFFYYIVIIIYILLFFLFNLFINYLI